MSNVHCGALIIIGLMNLRGNSNTPVFMCKKLYLSTAARRLRLIGAQNSISFRLSFHITWIYVVRIHRREGTGKKRDALLRSHTPICKFTFLAHFFRSSGTVAEKENTLASLDNETRSKIGRGWKRQLLKKWFPHTRALKEVFYKLQLKANGI
jgi:hypothetical protein